MPLPNRLSARALPSINSVRGGRMPYKDPENQREADRRWREANPEKAREASRRWREANPEKLGNKAKPRRELTPILEGASVYGS